MFKNGEVNLLNVFGLRQLTHCPPHFEIVSFNIKTSEQIITDWIYENLSGRFYVGDNLLIDKENNQFKFNIEKIAGFERHEEASYFGLFLPNINVFEYRY